MLHAARQLPSWLIFDVRQKVMIAFPQEVSIPIVNHVTGRRYKLVRAADLNPAPETLARVVTICNEPEVYKWLFRERLYGQPYAEEKARHWIEWSKGGWHSKTHFVFAILDDQGTVAAACDIKSNQPIAEIGYWASEGHRGVMTNGVQALCVLAASAGFHQLEARTRKGNGRSQRVLERAGFQRAPGRKDIYDWFIRELMEETPNKAPEPTPGSVTPRATEGASK